MHRHNHSKLLAMMLACPTGLGCSDSGSANHGGDLRVTVSAESLGANGYPFPPGPGNELAFVDGWEVRFDRIIAVIGRIRVSEQPDKNPGDQGQVGATVVERKGPFVVDLKRAGTDLDKGGAGKVAIRLPIDDLKDLFDLEQRYAFSYDLVPATTEAQRVNVDPNDPDVEAMITAQERVLLTGTATFRGTNCSTADPNYDFSKAPGTVRFRFGLSGAVSYDNCQNPDNTGTPISGEENQRGIQLLPHTSTVAQITIHTDHLFWPTIAHENLPFFDQFALNAVPQPDSSYVVNLEDLATVPVPTLTDRTHSPIPSRSCLPVLYPLPTRPNVTFDTGSQAIANLRDFVEFNARSMAHLNADGLCYVR